MKELIKEVKSFLSDENAAIETIVKKFFDMPEQKNLPSLKSTMLQHYLENKHQEQLIKENVALIEEDKRKRVEKTIAIAQRKISDLQQTAKQYEEKLDKLTASEKKLYKEETGGHHVDDAFANLKQEISRQSNETFLFDRLMRQTDKQASKKLRQETSLKPEVNSEQKEWTVISKKWVMLRKKLQNIHLQSQDLSIFITQETAKLCIQKTAAKELKDTLIGAFQATPEHKKPERKILNNKTQQTTPAIGEQHPLDERLNLNNKKLQHIQHENVILAIFMNHITASRNEATLIAIHTLYKLFTKLNRMDLLSPEEFVFLTGKIENDKHLSNFLIALERFVSHFQDKMLKAGNSVSFEEEKKAKHLLASLGKKLASFVSLMCSSDNGLWLNEWLEGEEGFSHLIEDFKDNELTNHHRGKAHEIFRYLWKGTDSTKTHTLATAIVTAGETYLTSHSSHSTRSRDTHQTSRTFISR